MTMKNISSEKVFTKFERFDMEKNISVEGTGLGMAITKSLVELMGGEIDVKSKYGEGSTFEVTLEQRIMAHEAEGIEIMDEIPKLIDQLSEQFNNHSNGLFKKLTDSFCFILLYSG